MVPWRKRQPTAPWRRDDAELDLPRSPFAERFYPANLPYWSIWEDGQLHSGLAPMHPSMDIYDLTDIASGPENIVLPKPDDQELDRLFLSERKQLKDNAGFRTWQIPALNAKPEPYGLDDPVPKTFFDRNWERFTDQLIKVDESKWLKIFSRQNWLDFREDCTKHIFKPTADLKKHKDNWWTVDNPVIWRNLRLSIELANRILIHLFEDRDWWLDAVLFRPEVNWSDIDPRIRSLQKQYDAFNPTIIEPVPNIKQRQTTKKMKEKFLECLNRTVYSFFDENVLDAGVGMTAMVPSITEKTEEREPTPCQVVTIQVGYLRALCSLDLSVPERANIHVALTSTILHETMHALWSGRTIIETGKCYQGEEPYMFPEIAEELGFSFEKHVFGGPLQATQVPTVPYRSKGRTTSLYLDGWPSRHHVESPLKIEEATGLQDDDPTFYYPLAASWASSLMTERFWKSVVPFTKHGDNPFLAPRPFRAEKYDNWYTLGSREFSAKRMRIPKAIDLYKSTYEAVHRTWQERKGHWNNLRPWYKDAYFEWSLTPWSMFTARRVVENFVDAHTRRNLPACLTEARKFRRHIDKWVHNGDNADLAWVYITLGHLMIASVPKMLEKHEGQYDTRDHLIFYANSRGAPKFMRDLKLTELDMDKWFVDGYNETYFLNPSESVSAQDEVFNCQALLNAELKFKKTPPAWIAALRNALYNFRAHAGPDDLANPDNKLDQWIDFNFEVPPYDSDAKWRHGELNIAKGRLISPPSSPTQLMPGATYAAGVFLDPDADPIRPLMFKSAKRKHLDLSMDDEKKPITHYTVGEVGDRRGPSASVWAVESDNQSGFDVYDITEICRRMRISDPRGFLLDVDLHGPALRVNGVGLAKAIAPWLRTLLEQAGLFDRMLGATEQRAVEGIRSMFGTEIYPVGKLLIPRRIEEISEFDGKDGMPFWITIQNDVYDLSDFKMSERDQTIINSLIAPTRADIQSNLSAKADVLARLEPHKCAVVQERPVKFLKTLRPFTLSMLRPHDNPTYGCFASIDGYVYNLNDYIEHHPGGRQILVNCLGREATEFFDWHDAEIMDDLQHNCIGRLVPEVTLDLIENDQVVIHDWVFDISALSPDQSADKLHHWMYAKINKLGGKDLSKDIQKHDEIASALAGLYQQKERIVGKVPRQRNLIDIPDEELKKHNDPHAAGQAWVEVEGIVYDVTPMMLHGRQFYEHEIPRIWAGTPLQDKTLGQWLTKNYSHRAVGRLIKGAAWPVSAAPDKEKLLRERRAAELTGFLRPRSSSRVKIPDDIREWIRTKRPTSAQLSHRMAVRFGDYEDYTPKEGVRMADKRMHDGTYEYPSDEPARKIRKMPEMKTVDAI